MEKYLVILIIVILILILYNYKSKDKFITSNEVQLQINDINKQLIILRNKHEYYLQYLTENEPNFNPLFNTAVDLTKIIDNYNKNVLDPLKETLLSLQNQKITLTNTNDNLKLQIVNMDKELSLVKGDLLIAKSDFSKLETDYNTLDAKYNKLIQDEKDIITLLDNKIADNKEWLTRLGSTIDEKNKDLASLKLNIGKNIEELRNTLIVETKKLTDEAHEYRYNSLNAIYDYDIKSTLTKYSSYNVKTYTTALVYSDIPKEIIYSDLPEDKCRRSNYKFDIPKFIIGVEILLDGVIDQYGVVINDARNSQPITKFLGKIGIIETMLTNININWYGDYNRSIKGYLVNNTNIIGMKIYYCDMNNYMYVMNNLTNGIYLANNFDRLITIPNLYYDYDLELNNKIDILKSEGKEIKIFSNSTGVIYKNPSNKANIDPSISFTVPNNGRTIFAIKILTLNPAGEVFGGTVSLALSKLTLSKTSRTTLLSALEPKVLNIMSGSYISTPFTTFTGISNGGVKLISNRGGLIYYPTNTGQVAVEIYYY